MNKWLDKYKSLSLQARASMWFLICTFLQKGISVITTPIFTRMLSTGEYGQVSAYTSWLSIVIIIVTLNIPEGVFTQGLVKHEDERYQFVSAIYGLIITMIAFWLGIYTLFHDFWNELFGLTTVQMYTMFLEVWASMIVMIWSREQTVALKYRILVAITLIHAILRPLFGFVVIQIFDDRVTARVLEMAVVDFLLYFPLFLMQMKRGKVFYSGQIWKYAVMFNLPLIAHFLSQTVLNSSDRIMIRNMISDDAAGIYTLAYQIALLVNLFNNAMKQALSPWTFRMLKTGKSERIQKIGFMAMIIMAAVCLLFIGFAPELVYFFAPPAFHDAIWVIPPVTISVFFQLVYMLFVDIEFYFESTNLVAISTVCGAVLNVILNFVFIRMFGYYAAGYTTLFCFAFIAVLHYFFMRRIARKMLAGKSVYDGKRVLALSLCVLSLGMILTVVYKNIIARYGFIAVIITLAIVFRGRLVVFLRETRSKEA